MSFRITGLSAEPFRHLYGLSDQELARHGVMRPTRGLAFQTVSKCETLWLVRMHTTGWTKSQRSWARACCPSAHIVPTALCWMPMRSMERKLRPSSRDFSHPLVLHTFTLTMQSADAIRAG